MKQILLDFSVCYRERETRTVNFSFSEVIIRLKVFFFN